VLDAGDNQLPLEKSTFDGGKYFKINHLGVRRSVTNWMQPRHQLLF
jgi:hypothetical protein